MLRSIAGAERFQATLQAYLRKFAYANARGSDLWAIFDTVSAKETNVVYQQQTLESAHQQRVPIQRAS